VYEELDYTQLAFLIGNVVGMFLKHKTPVNNKIIPLIILGVQIAVRFGMGVEAGGVAQAGFWGDLSLLGSETLWKLGQAVVDTGLALVTHSGARAVQELKRAGFRESPKPPEFRW
jgi:hypothetical protein